MFLGVVRTCEAEDNTAVAVPAEGHAVRGECHERIEETFMSRLGLTGWTATGRLAGATGALLPCPTSCTAATSPARHSTADIAAITVRKRAGERRDHIMGTSVNALWGTHHQRS
jgi:hypothetical protein